jgi:hypothetical protein
MTDENTLLLTGLIEEKISEFVNGPCYVTGSLDASPFVLATILEVPMSPEIQAEFNQLEDNDDEISGLADDVRAAERDAQVFVMTEEFNIQTQLQLLGFRLQREVAIVQLAKGIVDWLEKRRDEES